VHWIVRRILPIVFLFAFTVSIEGFAPDPAFEPPGHHYDGDSDDAGHVGKLRAHGVDAAVTDARPTATPSERTLRRARRDAPRPPQVTLEPLGSRAPPA